MLAPACLYALRDERGARIVTVTIVCFGAMRDFLPSESDGNRAKVTVDDGSTVGDVVDALGAPRALVFSVLLDGVHVTLGDEVSPGAEITLMPPFAGGAPGA